MTRIRGGSITRSGLRQEPGGEEDIEWEGLDKGVEGSETDVKVRLIEGSDVEVWV